MDGTIKRFRFDRDADIALVNAIMLAEAHVAKTGDVKEKFSGAFNMFSASHAVTSKMEKRGTYAEVDYYSRVFS